MNPSHYALAFALISLALASVAYLFAFTSRRAQDILNRSAYGFFIIATFLITHVSIQASLQSITGVTNGLILIGVLCWITLLGQILFNLKTAGTFVAPLATLLLLIQIFTAPQHAQLNAPSDLGALIKTHIYTAIIGQAFAILAFVISIIYFLQQRALKLKQFERLRNVSISLDRLNQSLIASIWTGFIFLTIGLILGAIYAQFHTLPEDFDNKKIAWALAVWFWYLATLLARNVFNISGRRLAQMTFVGFGIMAIGFFGLAT